MSQDFLELLNPSQKEAVIKENGAFVVLAGAGSGKTRVLIQRIIYLIRVRQIEPYKIMAVTFTNKAAQEMKKRLSETLTQEEIKDIWVGTFHGICNRLLRSEIKNINNKYSSNFVILDSQESQSLVKECVKSMNLDEKIYNPKRLQYLISELKSKSLEPSDFAKQEHNDPISRKLVEIYKLYQDKLELSNSLDFDDLLLLTLKLFKTNEERRNYYNQRFTHTLVDEFQDTNLVQYNLLKKLTLPDVKFASEQDEKLYWQDRSYCVVGDIDQSIYSWRGANYKLTLNFNKDYKLSEIIKLEENYRSHANILHVANAVIENNKQRIDKNLICTKGDGEKITKLEASDEVEEASFVAKEIKNYRAKNRYNYNQIAILYRTNAQSRALEESLMRSAIPYKLIGGTKFYERLEIKDILAYLRLTFNSSDSSALKRIINSPRRGIGASTLKQIDDKANSLNISLFSALEDMLDNEEFSSRSVQAIHKFAELIHEFKKQAQKTTIPELIRHILDKTGYLTALETSQDKEEAEGRIENIRELINVAEDFIEKSDDISLGTFLSEMALLGETDQLEETENKVTLMTVHASKGLEFSCVFVTGLEDGVFPHVRALQSKHEDDIEEERRLLYVAITRAEERLYLTHARYRRTWGMREYAEPSRFMTEIPEQYISNYYDTVKQDRGSIAQRRIIRPEDNTSNNNSSNSQLHTQTEKPRDLVAFTKGEIVNHKSFGRGEVLGILGTKQRKFYTIKFDTESFGKKMIAGENLQKVPAA